MVRDGSGRGSIVTPSPPSHHDRGSSSPVPASTQHRRPSGEPQGDGAASLEDTLSRVLRAVRLTTAYFFRWDAAWPFGLAVAHGDELARAAAFDGQTLISYHVVSEGPCYGGLVGHEPERLETHDVLLVPRGHEYVIGSSPEACRQARVHLDESRAFARAMARGDLPAAVIDAGGGDGCSRLVCGFLGCDLLPFNPVLAALGPIVRVRPSATPAVERLRFLVEYALSEVSSSSSGSRAVLLQLGELMFLEVLRTCVAAAPRAGTGWLEALADPWVGRALCALHQSPAAPWTLDALAQQAGISRSQLAARFAELVGQPPMQYLARWRLQIAMSRLNDASVKVSQVACEVGYGSEAAFSRAFKRVMGVSPARWRARPGSRAAPLDAGSR